MYNVSSSSTSPLKLWQIKKFNLEEVPSHYFHVVFLSEFPVVEDSLNNLWVAASMCFLRPDATLLQKNKRSSWNSSECHLFEDQYEHRAGRFGLVLHQTSILIQLEVEGGHILHHLIWVGMCGRILHWMKILATSFPSSIRLPGMLMTAQWKKPFGRTLSMLTSTMITEYKAPFSVGHTSLGLSCMHQSQSQEKNQIQFSPGYDRPQRWHWDPPSDWTATPQIPSTGMLLKVYAVKTPRQGEQLWCTTAVTVQYMTMYTSIQIFICHSTFDEYLWWWGTWDQRCNLWHLTHPSSPSLKLNIANKNYMFEFQRSQKWGGWYLALEQLCRLHLVPHLGIPSLPIQGGSQSESVHSSQWGCHENKEPHPGWDWWDKWAAVEGLYVWSEQSTRRWHEGTRAGGRVHHGTPWHYCTLWWKSTHSRGSKFGPSSLLHLSHSRLFGITWFHAFPSRRFVAFAPLSDIVKKIFPTGLIKVG